MSTFSGKAICLAIWVSFMSSGAVAANGAMPNVTPSVSASVEQKIAPSLLLEIGRQKDIESKRINVLIRTNAKIGPAERKQMEEAGLVLDSIMGDIVVAAGTSAAILKTARLDFVVFLEAAKQLEQK
jgi:hypothetical protein